MVVTKSNNDYDQINKLKNSKQKKWSPHDSGTKELGDNLT